MLIIREKIKLPDGSIIMNESFNTIESLHGNSRVMVDLLRHLTDCPTVVAS